MIYGTQNTHHPSVSRIGVLNYFYQKEIDEEAILYFVWPSSIILLFHRLTPKNLSARVRAKDEL
jgi:hypothetical protein